MIEFLKLVLPPLLDYARELFVETEGDSEAAIRTIKDRSYEIQQRRAKRDEQLDDKFGVEDEEGDELEDEGDE